MYQASSYDALILKNETECISYISFEFINRYSFNGKFLYIADFVTHDAYRSKGYGKIMLKKIREIAKINHCENIVLESGISRKDAHRFYENNNFAIQSYSFRQKL
jgi:GNAT superfamily N-acetyltransferase